MVSPAATVVSIHLTLFPKSTTKLQNIGCRMDVGHICSLFCSAATLYKKVYCQSWYTTRRYDPNNITATILLLDIA